MPGTENLETSAPANPWTAVTEAAGKGAQACVRWRQGAVGPPGGGLVTLLEQRTNDTDLISQGLGLTATYSWINENLSVFVR